MSCWTCRMTVPIKATGKWKRTVALFLVQWYSQSVFFSNDTELSNNLRIHFPGSVVTPFKSFHCSWNCVKFFFFVFLGPYPWHMEIPSLGVKSELKLLAYVTATAMWDPSHVCDLYHSSWPCWIFNPLSQARNWTCVLLDASQIHFHWAIMGIPIPFSYFIKRSFHSTPK